MARMLDWNRLGRLPKGILYPQESLHRIRLERHYPSEALAPFVEHYWPVAWDLTDQPPSRSEVLPYPSVHIVFAPAECYIQGVMTTRFQKTLEGAGWAFGIKFRPGGFRPWLKQPMHLLRDQRVPLSCWLPEAEAQTLHSAIVSADSNARKVALAEAFLLERLPAHDPVLTALHTLLEAIRTQPELNTTQAVAVQFGCSERSLQRLFADYIGVTPKWVIRRYRVHESMERLDYAPPARLTDLALDLGYFDQAHFTNDFHTETGTTPQAYRRND